ncbi:MAG: alpha-N-acetylglucosaminidase [Paramuribaculum sp.]|nr:alpha-N-acetylglucosaminidase [Paramuribaculum sp.]
MLHNRIHGSRMNLRLFFLPILILGVTLSASTTDPALTALMDRNIPGLSSRLTVRLRPDSTDFFTIDADNGRPRITANNRISAAVGIHHYLNRFAGIQLTWDCMNPTLPDSIPLPTETIHASTRQHLRYYLNYCTHSYSMAFWDKERWQREIDWMAFHGINLPLATTGTDAVWDATLRRLGYPPEKISGFIAAPAYQAWWLMNNLQGEGTPMTRAMLDRSIDLQRHILKAMRQLDMNPVLPGYSGMMPADARETLGLNVADPGKWCAYNRPAFLLPTDPAFAPVARIYYEEQQRLFGNADFYSMDPFHEGGNTDGVDLASAAKAIAQAMRKASPDAVWLIQGWQENPREEILRAVGPDLMTVIDLHCETVPQWSERGHLSHPWIWSMLLNFGGNVGLHGKISHIIDNFRQACSSSDPPAGLGLTMEGIENNPVMFELACNLPWLSDTISAAGWIHSYIRARYSPNPPAEIDSAWAILARTIYNAPAENRQQGTTESPFCARPSDNPVNVSAWANAEPYYDSNDIIRAARLFASAAPNLAGNRHYRYDLVDFTRQAITEAARIQTTRIAEAVRLNDSVAYRHAADRFMTLLHMQDSLLSTTPQFRVDTWLNAARNAAPSPELADAMERDARTLITTWGNRTASESGRLHDYAHREWAGILSRLYATRWNAWFSARLAQWDSAAPPSIDFFAIDSAWISSPTQHTAPPSAFPDPTTLCPELLQRL